MKMKHFIFFIAIWVASANQQLFAQEKLSLQDAITIALQNNYDIKLVNNDVAIAKNNVNLGNAAYCPLQWVVLVLVEVDKTQFKLSLLVHKEEQMVLVARICLMVLG